MGSLTKEYNRRFQLGDRGGLKLAWIENAVSTAPPVEAIPVSWIKAKIAQLISMDNEFAGLTVHIIKTLLNEWKVEQRNPEVDHDVRIQEFAEEMSKHGVT